jgi:hypothetical protein
VGVSEERNSHLAQVVQAADLLALFFGASQRGQKQTGENSNNSDNHQEFD